MKARIAKLEAELKEGNGATTAERDANALRTAVGLLQAAVRAVR